MKRWEDEVQIQKPNFPTWHKCWLAGKYSISGGISLEMDLDGLQAALYNPGKILKALFGHSGMFLGRYSIGTWTILELNTDTPATDHSSLELRVCTGLARQSAAAVTFRLPRDRSRTFCPSPFPSSQPHQTLGTTLWGGDYHCAQFTDEETEAWWEGRILNPGLSDSSLCSSCLPSPTKMIHRAGRAWNQGSVSIPDPSSSALMLCAFGQAWNLSELPVLLLKATGGIHSMNVNSSTSLPLGGGAHSLDSRARRQIFN